MPIVVVKSKDDSRSYLLEEGRPVFVGRAKECDISLPTPTVSRRHAVILYKNGVCGIKDLGSFNGTIVNDRPIDRPRHLSEEDVVRISFYSLRLRMNADAAIEPDGARNPFPVPAVSPLDNPSPPDNPDETIGMLTDPAREASGRRSAGRGARYGDSDILLPRAMQRDDDDRPAPGHDPRRGFFRHTQAPSRSPGEDGADAADDASSRHDTAYFTEPAVQPLDDMPSAISSFADPLGRIIDASDASDESDSGPIEDIPVESALTSAQAEAVIPLMEPEIDPTLTLEEDEVTNAALEKLIEDLPTYNRERLEGPEAAMEELVAEEPSAVIDISDEPSDPDSTASSLQPPEQDIFSYGTGAFDPVQPASVQAPAADDRAAAAAASSDSAGVEDIVIPPELMSAINTRLSLYALLFDLAEERRVLRAAIKDRPAPDVARELERQDAELEDLPTAEEASKRLSALQEAQRRDEEEETPRRLSNEMRAAEDLAVSQLLLIRDSNLEALPAVYKTAYRLAFDEPLARELSRAKIAHGRLFGGAVYLLALGVLAASASEEQKRVATRIRQLPEEGLDPNGSNVFAKLGQMATNLKNRDELRKETARLEDEGRDHAHLAELIAREKRFMLKTLSREFRQVYSAAAVHFIAGGNDLPVAVRVFLRYGAIGFKPWWMSGEVREFVLGDCTDNVLSAMEHEWNAVNILYADEYLEAVAQMECSPSPDERLARPGRSVSDLKTDRAYRRIVNARPYNVLMERMLASLDDRLRNLEREGRSIEERIAEKEAASPSASGSKDELTALQTEQQAVSIRMKNLQTHINRIENEVVTSILESVEEAEGLFRRGDLIMPEADFLVRREVATLFENARRMEGRHESFMPLVLRERFPLNRDMINIRGAIRVKMMALESLDPGVFVNVIIPAKKRLNRVELRMSPTMIILPVSGLQCMCSMGREGMEGGHLLLPICFPKENMRNRQLIHLLADFRWETARIQGGKDIVHSDTLSGAFMRVRWEWRNHPRTRREKGLVFTEMSDAANWRRVYETYVTDARNGGRKLFLCNQDFYAAIIGKYIDLPHGIHLLRRSAMAAAD